MEWIPHFTTLINWILRVGLFLISTVIPSSEPMCWIVDHTIQVGTKKAMVVLRAPLDVMNQERPLQLADVEVVSVSLKERWDGNEVCSTLNQIADQIGIPQQIISDQGPDLKKGLKEFISKQPEVHLTPDISHFFSNLLKKRYKLSEIFQELMRLISTTKSQLQQSELAHLIPPKQRTKSRFLNLGRISNWTKLIIRWRELNRDQNGSLLWNKFFNWFDKNLFFLQQFGREVTVINEIQGIIKKKGLNEKTYYSCLEILEKNRIPFPLWDSIQKYLKSELEFAKNTKISTCISSDVIESLFGKYKYQSKIHSFSELNRMVLILPCLCKVLTPELIERAFKAVSTKDVTQWIATQASDTLLTKRRKVLSSNLFAATVGNLGEKLREAS